MQSFTLYTILGVSQDATESEIRKAYRHRALATHPDKVDPNAPEALRQAAEGRFRQVCVAFETLGDSSRRRAYDLSLRPMPALPSGMSSRPPPRRSPSTFDEQSEQITKTRQDWAKETEGKQRERMRTTASRTQSTSSLASERSERPRSMSRTSSLLSHTSSAASTLVDEEPGLPEPSPIVSFSPVSSPQPSPATSRSSSFKKAEGTTSQASLNIVVPAPPAVIPMTPVSPRLLVSSPSRPTEDPMASSLTSTPKDTKTSSSNTTSASPSHSCGGSSAPESKRPWYSRTGSSTVSEASARSYFPKVEIPASERKKPWYARRNATDSSSSESLQSTTPSLSSSTKLPSGGSSPIPSLKSPTLSTNTSTTGRPLPTRPPSAAEVFSTFFPKSSAPSQAKGQSDKMTTTQWETFADLAKGIDPDLFEAIDQSALADKIFNAMQARMPQWEDRHREVTEKRVIA